MAADARFTTDDLAKLNDLWADFQSRKPATETQTQAQHGQQAVDAGHGIGTQAPSHSVS